MKIKRLLLCLLMLIMCVSLVACGSMEMYPLDELFGSLPVDVTPEDDDNSDCFVENIPEDQEFDEGDAEPPTEPPTETHVPIYEDSSVKPLLYKVSDENGNVIWLFGSIHVGREDYYPLPSYVLDAFDNSDSLAVELDIIDFETDTREQTEAYSQLIYLDGTTISDHISSELYTRSVEILSEYDAYTQAMDVYYPVLWSSIIESAMIEDTDADISLGIDRHLIERAKAAEKEILEVESATYQYGVMAGFSEELQVYMLETAVEGYDNPDEYNEDLKTNMDLWAAGDEYAFAAYLADSDESRTSEEEMFYEEYYNAMRVERNLYMADYAEDALVSGNEIFMCVGSAHVVGEGAVAQLLAERGYSVECITE